MAGVDLTGRTAVVTGASRGIELAIAQAIAAAGGNVVLTSRSQEAADAAAAQVGGRGEPGGPGGNRRTDPPHEATGPGTLAQGPRQRRGTGCGAHKAGR